MPEEDLVQRESSGSPLPLEGLVVIDLGQIYNAPYATMLLALAGANVIKVEPPQGDHLRLRSQVKGTGGGLSFYFVNVNKQSVTLNLKEPTGRSLFLELVDRANVVVENFRPGVMERLNLGPDVLLERKPSLVYASGSGYGQEGAHRDVSAMDLTVQAMAGVIASTGHEESPPVKAGPAVADFFGGIHLYGAIVTALFRQLATGKGARIDVAMLDSVYPSLLSNIAARLGALSPPSRTGNRHGGLASCPYNVYPTADGYLALVATREVHWNALLETMGRHDLVDDPRYSSPAVRIPIMNEVDEMISDWTRTLPTAELFEKLGALGVPCAPVRGLQEVIDDDHMRARGMIQDLEVPGVGVLPLMHSPLRFVGEDRVPLIAAPRLGEHNTEIFGAWLGHSEAELTSLREAGVI